MCEIDDGPSLHAMMTLLSTNTHDDPLTESRGFVQGEGLGPRSPNFVSVFFSLSIFLKRHHYAQIRIPSYFLDPIAISCFFAYFHEENEKLQSWLLTE